LVSILSIEQLELMRRKLQQLPEPRASQADET
jgi:hypothetical protein